MATASVTAAAGLVSDYIRIDLANFRTGVSLICDVGVGITGNYTIEVSNDPATGATPLAAIPQSLLSSVTHWVSHDVLQAQTADAVSNLAYPVQWLRVNANAVASGTVTLGVAQGY